MKNLLFLFLVVLAAAACRSKTGNVDAVESQSMTLPSELPADFTAFYEKFHQDSLYQISHINWPLQGMTDVLIDSTHSEKRSVQWQKETWRMHHAVDFNKGEYHHEWTPMSETLIIERIRAKAANYGLERRFAKNADDEWELIYYADMMEM